MGDKLYTQGGHSTASQASRAENSGYTPLTPIDYENLLENYIDENYLIVNSELVIVNFNKSFRDSYLHFFNREIKRGENIMDHVIPERKEIVRNIYQRALNGEEIEMEIELPNFQNLVHAYVNRYKPYHDPEGNITGVIVSTYNITATRQAQQENRKNEIRYKHIVENSLDAFFFNSEEGVILDVNAAAVELFGYSHEEFMQLNRSDIMEDVNDTVATYYTEGAKKGKMKGEAIGIKKNGERFPFEFSAVIYHDVNFEQRICTFVNDITGRKNAEKLIEFNEKRFRALIENASDIVLLTNETGVIQYASPSFERITGYSFERVSKNHIVLISNINPVCLDHLKETFHQALANPGVAVPRLFQLRHANGHYIWLKGVITNLLHEENVKAIVANYRDITLRKEAEARAAAGENRFKALVEKGADIIVLTRADGLIAYVSPAFEKLTGFSAEEVVGKHNREMMHPDQALESKSIIEQIASMPGASLPRTNRLKVKNGGYIWVEGYVTNLLHDENVQAYVSNFHDITERLKAAELVRKSENNLKVIFDNTSEAFLLMDTDLKVKAFNSNALTIGILSNDKDIAIGDHILNSIDHSRHSVVLPLFERALKGESIQYDRYFQKPSGLSAWIEFSINPVYEDGNITACCITGRDITARKAAEEEIRTRELRFRSILENSHDFLMLFDAEGKIEFYSPSIEKAFGTVNTAFKIYDILDRVHPDDQEAVRQKFKISYKKPSEVLQVTFRQKKKDGTYVWLDGTFTNMLQRPETQVLVANFRNITEQKLFEEQLALMASIVNFSEDSIMSMDLNETILSWNQGAEKMFGYTAEEAIGKRTSIIIPPERHHEEVDILNRIKNGGSVKHYETQRMNKKGERIDISLMVSPIRDHDGQITGASKIARDISDRKKSEAIVRNSEKRFRSLIQNSNDGLGLFMADGEVLDISPTGRKILGIDNTGQTSANLRDIIYPEDLEPTRRTFYDSIADASKIKSVECRIITPSGHIKWLEISSQNMLAEPAVGAIVINFRDITDRKSQEIEREKLIKTLNQNNKDLRDFSYITSHNLKAPLSNLMGFIELLNDIPVEDPTLKTILEGFSASTVQLNNTVNDLVKILINRDTSDIEQKEIHFNKIFELVKGQLTNQLNEAQATFEIDFNHAPSVIFNETYLESIFMNLLTNSIKYRAFDRPLKIVIATHKEEDAIVMTFADNGIGFDMVRHKDRIFGLYQRFHDRPNSKGLGLYLIKSQIESLQGSISVDSAEDAGTTFTLRFHK